MATSVLLSCNLNDANLPSFVFLDEDSTDASFLINCILFQRVKMQETGIVLVCLHQTFEHYQNAGLRLGYNLNMFKDRKIVRSLDILKDISDNFMTSKFILNTPEELLKYFLESIMTNINELLTTKNKVVVIIDDLSFLINLGVEEREIFILCKHFDEITKSTKNISIIVKINNSNSYQTLCNNIDDIASLKIKVEKLRSGNFKEVDGKITVTKKDEQQFFDAVKPKKTVLFKVVDKSIKIFALGELGVKI